MNKTWTKKLHASTEYEVKPAPIDIAGMKAGQIMLVPSAKLVDDFIRTIPAGEHVDIKTLRSELAWQHGAEVTCPITTGFHLRTVAEAAFESFNAGNGLSKITPVWRVIDQHTPTFKKLSYDPGFLLAQQKIENMKF